MATTIITAEEFSAAMTVVESRLDTIQQSLASAYTTQNRWLRSSEVAKILGVSKNTVVNLRYSGQLPYTTMGKSILYDRIRIEQLLEQRTRNNSNK